MVKGGGVRELKIGSGKSKFVLYFVVCATVLRRCSVGVNPFFFHHVLVPRLSALRFTDPCRHF